MSESTNCVSVATIIPPASPNPNGPQPTMGTRVVLSDGSELAGITSITMKAKPGGVWEAIITVTPHHVESITAEVLIVQEREPIRYQDPNVIDATTLSETVRRYVPSIRRQEELDGTPQDARQQGQDSV